MARNAEIMVVYDGQDSGFALADALIEARLQARLTQEEVAARMGTSHAVVARLESGSIVPSAGTLARYARATGRTLRIALEPGTRPASAAGTRTAGWAATE